MRFIKSFWGYKSEFSQFCIFVGQPDQVSFQSKVMFLHINSLNKPKCENLFIHSFIYFMNKIFQANFVLVPTQETKVPPANGNFSLRDARIIKRMAQCWIERI